MVSTLSTTFKVESDITIGGTIFTEPTDSYPFELPLGGASILIVVNDRNYTATTNANGAYSVTIPLSVADQTTQPVMQLSAAGHVPQAVLVDLNRGSQTINATLSRTSSNMIIVETPLHHLL